MMNREKYWKNIRYLKYVKGNFDEEQLEELKMFFDCGWEAYEESLNDNNLIVTDLYSIDYINKFSKNIKRCIGVEENMTFVKLPTLSRFMITATTSDSVYDAVDMYRDY